MEQTKNIDLKICGFKALCKSQKAGINSLGANFKPFFNSDQYWTLGSVGAGDRGWESSAGFWLKRNLKLRRLKISQYLKALATWKAISQVLPFQYVFLIRNFISPAFIPPPPDDFPAPCPPPIPPGSRSCGKGTKSNFVPYGKFILPQRLTNFH